MNIFRYSYDVHYDKTLEVGEVVEVDCEYVKVISIIKVDFANKVMLFNGVLKEDLY